MSYTGGGCYTFSADVYSWPIRQRCAHCGSDLGCVTVTAIPPFVPPLRFDSMRDDVRKPDRGWFRDFEKRGNRKGTR